MPYPRGASPLPAPLCQPCPCPGRGDDDADALSDFPHAEGLADPTSFQKLIADLDEADRQRIMRDNSRALLGLA